MNALQTKLLYDRVDRAIRAVYGGPVAFALVTWTKAGEMSITTNLTDAAAIPKELENAAKIARGNPTRSLG